MKLLIVIIALVFSAYLTYRLVTDDPGCDQTPQKDPFKCVFLEKYVS